MKNTLAAAVLMSVIALPAAQAAPVFSVDPGEVIPISLATAGITPLDVAASYSCTPRKTCTKIRSCDEAKWYFYNCAWGHRLDGDSDAIPCENLCWH